MMEWIAGLLGERWRSAAVFAGKSSQRQGHHRGEHRSKGRKRDVLRRGSSCRSVELFKLRRQREGGAVG